MGVRNDVTDILLEADLLLHSSTAETCTYAITESMAAGIPAVATDAGAAREQIEDGVSGFVVGRDDLDGFVGRVAELLDDPQHRHAMGAIAQQRWHDRFDLMTTVRQYHALYTRKA